MPNETHPMTEERRDRIRTFLTGQWLMRDGESALSYARELYNETEFLRAEREKLASVSVLRCGHATEEFVFSPPVGSYCRACAKDMGLLL